MAKPQIIVGISGGSGSGKTSLLNSLMDYYKEDEICIVSQDNYYRPIEEQHVDENGEVNFDLPASINIEHFQKDLKDLAEGRPITKEEYCFNNEDKKPKIITIQPAKIVVIEGLFIFHFSSLMDRLDLCAFIHTDTEERLQRRIKRDSKERGYPEETVRYQWDNHVEPAYENYLKPYKKNCDIIIDNNDTYDQGLQQLVDMINARLEAC